MNPNFQDKYGRTALHYAVISQNVKTVKILQKHFKNQLDYKLKDKD